MVAMSETSRKDGSRSLYAFLVQKASSTGESNYEFFFGFSHQKTPHGYQETVMPGNDSAAIVGATMTAQITRRLI